MPKEITFKCRFCGMSKPLDEMVILTRFFPPIVACRDCEKNLEKPSQDEDKEEEKREI